MKEVKKLFFAVTLMFCILTAESAAQTGAMYPGEGFSAYNQAESLFYSSTNNNEVVLQLLAESKTFFDGDKEDYQKYLGLANIEYLRGMIQTPENKKAAEKSFELSQKYVKQSLSIKETGDGLRLLVETYQQLMNFKGFFYQATYGNQLDAIPMKAIKIDPSNSRAYTDLALFYLYAPAFVGGSPQKAVETLQRALDTAETDVEKYLALCWLSEGLCSLKMKEKALEAVSGALAVYPDNKSAKDTFAKINALN